MANNTKTTAPILSIIFFESTILLNSNRSTQYTKLFDTDRNRGYTRAFYSKYRILTFLKITKSYGDKQIKLNVYTVNTIKSFLQLHKINQSEISRSLYFK